MPGRARDSQSLRCDCLAGWAETMHESRRFGLQFEGRFATIVLKTGGRSIRE